MKRLAGATVVLVAVLLLHTTAARADLMDEAWKRGNDAFFRGDYAAAVAAYEQLDRQGIIAADLYYNLGNSYFRLGNLGRAIWSYERAVSLEPDSDDARFNLTQARRLAERRARDKIEGADRDPLWIRAVTALPASTETWLFVALYLAVFVALFARRRARDSARVALGTGAAILAFAALCSGLLLAGRAYLDRVPFGIILPESVAVKEGADPNHRTSFEIHAGLRVRLFERDQDWIRIRLSNGLEGWVREQDVGKL